MAVDIEAARARVAALKKELEEREAALPAHSARPHQLMAIEELEERVEEAEAELAKLEGTPPV